MYEKILLRQSGMDYSPGIQFEKSLVNMDLKKALTKTNQPEKVEIIVSSAVTPSTYKLSLGVYLCGLLFEGPKYWT